MYLFSFIYIHFIHSGCHAEFIGKVGQPTCNNWNGRLTESLLLTHNVYRHELFKLLSDKKNLNWVPIKQNLTSSFC